MGGLIAKSSRRWRRFFFRIALALIVLGVGVAIAAPRAIGWIIGSQLKSQLALNLNARLEFSQVIYQFPYSVHIDKARLIIPSTTGGKKSTVDIAQLHLTLAKLPTGPGAVVVQKLLIDNPVVHLSAAGPLAPSASPANPPSTPPRKLSDIFQLQRVSIRNGQFEYDFNQTGQNLPKMVWGHLDASMTTTASAPGIYKFAVAIADLPVVKVSSSGSFDIDTLQLNVDKINLALQCDPNNPSQQIPPKVLAIIQQYQLAGQLTMHGSARIPMKSPARLWCNTMLTLKDGHCLPPGWTGPVMPVKFEITASNVPSPTSDLLPQTWPSSLPEKPANVRLRLTDFSAASGNQIFKIDRGELTFNPNDRTWTASKLQGVADVGDGPGPLQGDNLRLICPFVAAGDSATGLRVAVDDAFATGLSNRVHVNRISGQIALTRTGLTTTGLNGTCAQGQIKTNVKLRWTPLPQGPETKLIYGCDTQIKQLDLHLLATDYTTDPAARKQAAGQLDLNLNCHGSILKKSPTTGKNSAADRLEGAGDFDISNGHFADIPVLKEVVAALHSPGETTVGEAAARFDIAHEIIRVKRAAASSPALGIQGNGTLGFDRKVNMNFVATPLADWSKDIKNAGILGDATAAIFGQVQNVVNGVQRAIYQFRVTGDIAQPTVTAVPVPFLADNVGALFQKMAGDQKQGSVADGLEKQSDSTGK